MYTNDNLTETKEPEEIQETYYPCIKTSSAETRTPLEIKKAIKLTDNLILLEKLGYMVTIPANAIHICVMGKNGKYFNAKNKAANTITSELNRIGVLAWNTQSVDGYYDFYCK